LQIETICEGRRLLWNNEVRIHDEKPTKLKACARQRLRWAQGRWFVSFKNTPRLFKAMFTGKISFWEFLSTFWGMYNMSPFAVLTLEGILMLFLELARAYIPTASYYVTLRFSSMFSFNFFSILVMFYSIYVLFYVADYLDNHRTPKLKEIWPVFVSIFINMGLGGFVNLIGLFKHRKQNVWVKTEHSINVDMDTVLASTAQTLETKAEPAAEDAAESLEG